MARSSHSKQREPGLQSPLRPAIAILTHASKTLTQAAYPPTWSSVSALTMSLKSGFPLMDDKGRISISGGNLRLQPGIYKIKFWLQPTMTTAGYVSCAVTNADGSATHFQSRAVDAEATDGGYLAIEGVIVVSSPDTDVAFRAAGEQADAGVFSTIDCVCVERIGNHDEQ